MDPLVELPREQWPEVMDTLKSWWPHGIPGYYALATQLKHPDLGVTYNVQAFTPYGDHMNGVILFNNKVALNEIIIITTSKATNKLEEALVTTKRINWTQELCVPWADCDVIRLMGKVAPRVGTSKFFEGATMKHALTKDMPLYENVICPDNTYVKQLSYENIPQVDQVWPHRYATSPKFFETLIRNGLSYGLFSSEDNSLMTWVFINEVGFLTHLYCEEKYRKKGYSEFLMKHLSNDQLSRGKDVFCYIIEDNIKSLKLYRKLNYEVIGRGVWMFYKPDSSKDS